MTARLLGARTLRLALRAYCGHGAYLRALIEGAPRIDLEAAGWVGSRGSTKILAMKIGLSPTALSRGCKDTVHEAGRPAHVKMSARIGRTED